MTKEYDIVSFVDSQSFTYQLHADLGLEVTGNGDASLLFDIPYDFQFIPVFSLGAAGLDVQLEFTARVVESEDNQVAVSFSQMYTGEEPPYLPYSSIFLLRVTTNGVNTDDFIPSTDPEEPTIIDSGDTIKVMREDSDINVYVNDVLTLSVNALPNFSSGVLELESTESSDPTSSAEVTELSYINE